ncbi:hypothetical protein D9M71_736700 [compost metagenome]
MVTQSSVRQAGTTPAVEIRPLVAFIPTRLFNAAGTRPEPAVSVPSAKLATPSATASDDPALEPPDGYSGNTLLGHAPYGERLPLSPVANWSRLVLPSGIAPRARSCSTMVAERSGT